jgi:asparagine synthase (glutamine-hydrolysing)
MCGIVGAFYFNSSPRDLGKRLERASQSLAHRGPDSKGYYSTLNAGVAIRRLAITDIRTGNQPVFNEDKTLALILNGEVFNYQEIRVQLEKLGHKFTTNSDTEVALHLFEEIGEETFAKLNGMFAIAIYDVFHDRLILGRDHCGIKPLYYQLDRNHLVFASEIKAILAFEDKKGNLDKKSFLDYLTFQFVLEDRTLFQDVHKLLPGHYLVCDEKGVELYQYWAPSLHKTSIDRLESHTRYSEILNSALNRQLRSEVPIGFHLSGGVDSASLIELAKDKLTQPLLTFSSGFPEGGIYDEQSLAKRYADLIGSSHKTIYLSSEEFIESLPNIIWYMDEPAGDSGIVPQFFTNRVASQQVKVIFSGLGVDETMTGYARHLVYYLSFALRDAIMGTQFCQLDLGNIQDGLRLLSSYEDQIQRSLCSGRIFSSPFEQYMRFVVRMNNVRGFLSKSFLEAIGTYSPISTLQADFESFFNQQIHTRIDVLDYALWIDFRYMLPPLLQMEDRASMAYSIEARVPFLDRELVEFVFSLPSRHKMHNGILKSVLREVMQNKLPDYLINRKEKIGRPTPFNLWAQQESNNLARRVLSSKQCLNRGIFNPKRLSALISEIGLFDRKIWALLNIELWQRIFIDDFPRTESQLSSLINDNGI